MPCYVDSGSPATQPPRHEEAGFGENGCSAGVPCLEVVKRPGSHPLTRLAKYLKQRQSKFDCQYFRAKGLNPRVCVPLSDLLGADTALQAFIANITAVQSEAHRGFLSQTHFKFLYGGGPSNR